MTQPNPGSWQAKMGRNSPELFKEIMDVRNNVLTEGALPLKVKVLMTMLCDALLSHPDGVAAIADRARAAGATEDEIAETVAVAFLMGGTAALVTACNAFKE